MFSFSAGTNVYRCPKSTIYPITADKLYVTTHIYVTTRIFHLQSWRKFCKNSQAWRATPIPYCILLGSLVFLAYMIASFYSVKNDRTVNIYAEVTFRELDYFLSWLKISDFILSSCKSAEFCVTNWVILCLSAGTKNVAQRATRIFLKHLNSWQQWQGCSHILS